MNIVVLITEHDKIIFSAAGCLKNKVNFKNEPLCMLIGTHGNSPLSAMAFFLNVMSIHSLILMSAITPFPSYWFHSNRRVKIMLRSNREVHNYDRETVPAIRNS